MAGKVLLGVPMAPEIGGWQVDPFGVHEWRFFSLDGKPTQLVCDGDIKSYDPPPLVPQVRSAVSPVVGESHQPPVTEEPQKYVPPTQFNKPTKVIFSIALAVVVISALVLAIQHFDSKPHHPSANSGVSTTTTTGPTTTTAPPLPTALKPNGADAAAALVSAWASGNRAEALTVATPAAVNTLFAEHYSSGLVIDRGCSMAFSPIVCTYGPPGGASPTDPIYEIDATQVASGWYVSSATMEN